MATVETIHCSQDRIKVYIITIRVDKVNKHLSIWPPRCTVSAGDMIQWQLENEQYPFAIAFTHPFTPAPVMLYGASSDKKSSKTREYLICANPIPTRRSTYGYSVFCIDIEGSDDYTIIHDDPVIIVEPSGGDS